MNVIWGASGFSQVNISKVWILLPCDIDQFIHLREYGDPGCCDKDPLNKQKVIIPKEFMNCTKIKTIRFSYKYKLYCCGNYKNLRYLERLNIYYDVDCGCSYVDVEINRQIHFI